MKTKEEILKMNKEELIRYKWSEEICIKKENSDCSDCSYCWDCSDCSHCSDCWGCIKAKKLKYAICNIEMTMKEYKAKIKELK